MVNCYRELRSLAVLRLGLERGVHLLQADLCFVERALESADEDAAEALGLDEAAPVLVERLDPEAVLAVEEAADEETADPAQLALRLDRDGVRRSVGA